MVVLLAPLLRQRYFVAAARMIFKGSVT